MKSIRTILVDDEIHALETLDWDLRRTCPEVEILAMCQSAEEGIRQIRLLKPELVFLDIEMPHMNAFDMLEKMGRIDFDIIFCTAYDQYAVRAFKVSAVDYILKPVGTLELREAIDRFIQREEKSMGAEQLLALLDNFRHDRLPKVALNTLEGIEFVNTEDILYCRSDGNYTKVFTADDRMILVSQTLKYVEDLLPDDEFCRTHHSFLANLRHAKKYLKGDAVLVINPNHSVSVSRSRKDEVLKRLKAGR